MSGLRQSIAIILEDGDASRRWRCELSNWNGLAYRIPRTMIRECSNFDYINTSGVYFLIGSEGQTDDVYIGESERVLSRVIDHIDAKNEWQGWTECVIFVSSHKGLNKAKVKHMESSLYDLARDVGRCRLKNSNCPTKSDLSDSDFAGIEGYLEKLRLLLGVMGYRFLEPVIKDKVCDGIRFYISGPRSGVKAEGSAVPDGFIVSKGSKVSDNISKSLNDGYRRIRGCLESDGIIVDGVFVKDYLFDSPSAAASVVKGCESNGQEEWKTKDGETLKQVRDSEQSEG